MDIEKHFSFGRYEVLIAGINLRIRNAVRFPIPISKILRPLFAVFGFRAFNSFVALTDEEIEFSFGAAHTRTPLDNIERAGRYRWPIHYGLGAKLGPDGGVAYVGTRTEVVQVFLKRSIPMVVWGPFRRSAAKCVIFNVEDAEAFLQAINPKLGS